MSDNSENDEKWRKVLTGELTELIRGRHFFKRIPSEPRCRICNAPFRGLGGQFGRLAYRRVPFKINPHFCTGCFNFMASNPGGAEVEVNLFFADIRGATTLAQDLCNTSFIHLIDL